VRLADADAGGRLRLDAIARYLQDVAADDVADAGWAADEHVWVVRRTVVEVAAPPAVDEEVELATWCGGVAGSAAARRTSLRGDAGGLVETETIWIHLDRSMRPARLGERFLSVYGEACGGRRASTRLELPGPPPGAESTPWPLRATDVDRLGHVNNAAFWAPVEEHLSPLLRGPVRATLEYRQPIDLGEAVEVAHDGTMLWLVAGGEVRASARLERE
jgi:acyl-ACP thioesterase